GDISTVTDEWDRACKLHYPGGVSGTGWEVADSHWLNLVSAFPGAEFTVHHIIGREDAMMPPRAAVRWSLDGTHDGWGAFGRPSGKRVHVMGICHAEFGPWGLRREWVCYDEVAIWAQILAD
ncbi:MAG: ester cyclase, partial [Pseudomonadota bacterium]